MNPDIGKYSKFFISLAILILLTCIADQIIGRILRHLYFKQTSGLYYRTTYAIDSTKADILVFGSSRASHHYVPEVFEDNLNMSFYNLGREGNFLLYNYAVFKSVVKRYSPKIVVFDINYNELYYDKTEYERLSSLLPYYKGHPEIRSIIELKSPFEKYKIVSELYPFNSSLLTIGIGNMDINKTRKGDTKGYVPLLNIIGDTVLYKIKPAEGLLDSNKVNAINDIVQYCYKNKIRLAFIQSPIFAKVGNTISLEYFDELTKKNKTVFWNFINDTNFMKNHLLFQDQYHLNDRGAKYFSNLLVEKIKVLQMYPDQIGRSSEEYDYAYTRSHHSQ